MSKKREFIEKFEKIYDEHGFLREGVTAEQKQALSAMAASIDKYHAKMNMFENDAGLFALYEVLKEAESRPIPTPI